MRRSTRTTRQTACWRKASGCRPGLDPDRARHPGHTSNHLCFALEESGALFTGDHVMGWSTTVVAPPDGDMADYMASLEKLYAREDRVYYPAHGPAVRNPRQLVRGMIGHRRQRERQIVRLLGQRPQSIAELVRRCTRASTSGCGPPPDNR